METNTLTFTSLITPAGPVRIVANENLPDKPLITPMVNKDQSAKTDLTGNPLGSIMLEQYTQRLNGSFLNNRRRVAFITGAIDGLQKLLDTKGLKAGSEVPGQIVIREDIAPMWPGQQPKINPQTKKEITIMVGLKPYPIYSKMSYTDSREAKDRLINTPEDVLGILAQIEAVQQASTVSTETARVPMGAQQKTSEENVPIDGGKDSEDFVNEVITNDLAKGGEPVANTTE